MIVLDVSAAYEILLKKEHSDFFASKLKQSQYIIAPDLFVSEMVNTAWKYHQFGHLTHEELLLLIDDGLNLIDEFFPVIDFWKEALAESIRLKHSVYDVFYFLVARRNDAHLLTRDRKLIQIATENGLKVN